MRLGRRCAIQSAADLTLTMAKEASDVAQRRVSDVVRDQETLDVSARQLIGLAAVVERDDGDGDARAERLGHADRTLSAGFVTIEHQDHSIEVGCQELRLMARQS
jgi:hypothetical protein